MLYYKFRINNLIEKAVESYENLSDDEIKMSMPQLTELMDSKAEDKKLKYCNFLTPVNNLVDMDIVNFDEDVHLERIIDIVRYIHHRY